MHAIHSLPLRGCFCGLDFQWKGHALLQNAKVRRVSNPGRRSRNRICAAAAAAAAYSFQRCGECVLYASRNKPKALVKFLGGAFIGASPELTYRYFIELLAKEGFLILAAPYNVTFDHEACAREIHSKWVESVKLLESSGCPSAGLTPEDVLQLPRVGIGHSNGALMQVLIGSCCGEQSLPIPKASVVISFNNKRASEAVPFFDQQLGPSLSQLADIAPLNDAAKMLADEALKAIADFLPLPPGVEAEDLNSVKRFVQQIPPVFAQVASGISEFQPSPVQNSGTISASYSIPHNLLVKFKTDPIDETDVLEDLLRPQIDKIGGTLTKLVLDGTHLTPLAQDIKLQAGNVYTPIDAVNQAVRSAALADIRILAQRIGSWFDSLECV